MKTQQADKQTRWSNHINTWKDGSLSQIAYCKKKNLSYSAFGYWRTRLKKRAPSTRKNSTRADFTAIKLKPTINPKAHFLLKINNKHSIEIQTGFDKALLVQLIQAIEGVE